MRVPSGHDREPLELKMTPMIDVVFLLLVFFLWTSSFEEPEFLLPSALADPPAAAGSSIESDLPVEPFDEVIVRITLVNGNAAMLMNDQPIATIDDLQLRLQAIIAIGVTPPVVIDPDADVPMGVAIQIYDIARSVGFDRVLFAARWDV